MDNVEELGTVDRPRARDVQNVSTRMSGIANVYRKSKVRRIALYIGFKKCTYLASSNVDPLL